MGVVNLSLMSTHLLIPREQDQEDNNLQDIQKHIVAHHENQHILYIYQERCNKNLVKQLLAQHLHQQLVRFCSKHSLYLCFVGKLPICSRFVNSPIRTFGLTSPAIDTIFSDYNCHNLYCLNIWKNFDVKVT